MSEMLEMFLKDLVYVICVVVVPIICKYVVSYIQLKKVEKANSITNTKNQELFTTAVDLVERAVDMISQTYVDALKEGGKFDAKAQEEALHKAMTTTVGLMSEDVREFIILTYNDLHTWVKLQVESYIKSTK